MKAKNLLSIVLTSAIFHFTLSVFSQGVWTQKANYWSAPLYRAVGFSIGTKGYLGTGYYYQEFWEWDQTTNVWTQKANYGGGNRDWATGFSIGNKGYIGTGTSGSQTQDFWEWDQASNIWIQKAFFSGGVRVGAVGFSIGAKGYIGTGNQASIYHNDLWEYNPSNDSWVQKATIPAAGRIGATGFSIGNKGYIGTGGDGSGNWLSDFWEWDQTNNTWTQKANLPAAGRYSATSFAIGAKGYIGGGLSGSTFYSDFWEWNQTNNSWIQVANFGGGKRCRAIGFAIGNKGYMGTGSDSINNVTQDFWEFNPQDTSSNLLTGKVFIDANINCVMDGGDTPLANWFVKAESSTSTLYGSSSANGNYEIWVPSGTYSVTLIPKTYWNQVCPLASAGYNVPVSSQDTVTNLDFGADVTVSCPDLAVSIGTTTQRRCLTNNYYHVQYWNNGTTAANTATMTVTFDNKITPLSSTVPWSSVSGNSYSWNLSSVQPGQYVSLSIQDSVSCSANLGDILYVSAVIITAGDCDGENNVDEYNSIITGSFDPNAKEATTTTNKVNIKQANILPTDTINYTIHFQNTGTDTAFKVVIYDTLDLDLNIPSIVSGVSSHPYTMQLMGAGILKWTFNNILLPDSNINEPASHGFVKFQILQKPNNPNGTVIKNWAGIVFDFNAPVITDTVVLTVNTPVSVQDVKEDDNAISIYPNPSNGKFQVSSLKSQVQSIEIYNVMGVKVHSMSPSGGGAGRGLAVDLSENSNGVYLLQMKTAEGIVTKKIIVQR